MERLIPVTHETQIPDSYRGTPLEELLRYHNLDAPLVPVPTPRILIGMCMDNRKHLHIPDNFAYILRTGGGNLRHSEFKVSYAIGVGGVETVALLGHTHCGMTNLMDQRETFITGLMEHAGWDREWAEHHFMNFAPMFEIHNEIDFVISEARRIRMRYPKVRVAPMLYRVEDNLLYLLRED